MKTDTKSIKQQLLEARQGLLDCLGPDGERLLGETLEEHWFVVQMQNRLERIERALQRLEQGHYGICGACNLPIQPERLEAMPEAELCVGCQSSLEQKRSSPPTHCVTPVPLHRRKGLAARSYISGSANR
jgi:RNA polymerase-binding transcription factor DksA